MHDRWTWWAIPLVCLAIAAIASQRVVKPPPISSERQIVDGRGETVNVPLPFHGAALYFGPVETTEYLLVTRDPASLVATTGSAGEMLTHGFLADLYPNFDKTVATLNGIYGYGQPSIEELLLLRPSITFVWPFDAPQMERLGLAAAAFLPPQNDDEIFARAKIYADALGQTGRAEELRVRYQQAIHQLTAELGSIASDDRPSVIFIAGADSGGIQIAGGSWNTDYEFAGGSTAVDTIAHRTSLNLEHLLRADPDVILLNAWGAEPPAAFMADPRWQHLKAVMARRVYQRPPGAAYVFNGIVEKPLWLRWLAEILHPERLTPELRSLMRDTYRQDLGIDLPDAQIDKALAVEANHGSAGYERFEARGG